jgi:hypothetical protein
MAQAARRDFTELEDDIRLKRQLPYTLTVEKKEGKLIYTRNIWGNSVIYRETDDGMYEIYTENTK